MVRLQLEATYRGGFFHSFHGDGAYSVPGATLSRSDIREQRRHMHALRGLYKVQIVSEQIIS